MDEAVRNYIESVDPAHRPLFERVHRLVLAAHPGADVVLSYRIPTYKVGKRRLSSAPGSTGYPSMAGSKAATAASPSAIPSCGPARARSGCGRRTRRPSPTTSSSAWSAPPWKPDREFLP